MSSKNKKAEPRGLEIERFFTKEGVSPYDQFVYDYRTSVIKNPNGTKVFEMNIFKLFLGFSANSCGYNFPTNLTIKSKNCFSVNLFE